MLEALSRLLGVSIIYPAGRFLLPVPRRVPVTIAVGAPLAVPPTPSSAPTDAEVDALHEQLMEALSAIYADDLTGGYPTRSPAIHLHD